MNKKLTIIIPIILVALAASIFIFFSPFGKGGLGGIYKSEAEASVSRTGLTLDLDFGNNDGNAAPTVYDSSGFARHATAANAQTCNNSFCDFDGSTDYITLTGTGVYNSAETSFAIKFTPDFEANDGTAHYILDSTSANRYTILKHDSGSANVLVFYLGTAPIQSLSLGAYQSYWKVGQENILIVVGSAGAEGVATTNIWLNGNQILTNDTTGWTSADPATIYIGSAYTGATPFNGQIHYLKVWNRLLTDDEVAILSADRETTANTAQRAGATGSSTGTLVGHWTMDVNDMSADGATMYDKSGFGNNGTMTGTTTSTGKIGQARDFNGTSDYITTSKNLYSLGDKTFVAWVKPIGTSTLGIFKQYNWRLAFTNGHFIQGHYKDGVGYAYSSDPLIPDEWSQVVLVYSSITEQIYFYNNGVYDLTASSVPDFADTLKIIGFDGIYYFNGAIDDVRIYNYALSADEITNLYSASKEVHMQAPSKKDMSLNLDFGNNNGSDPVTVFDSSGFNRNATSTTGATMPACTDYFCDFINDYFTTNATNVFNSSNISYAVKFTPDFVADEGATRYIFDADAAGAGRSIIWVNSVIYIYLGNTSEIEQIPLATYRPYWKVGEENILVLVADDDSDGTAHTFVWLNGNKILGGATGDETAWTAQNPTNLHIGSRYTMANYFDGKIHYFKVWNRLLTDAEVQYLSADRNTYMR
ncbi:LamG domain-containing protein [Patescibacteria group bacterium]|nr:LamG domain-containing protein [Patescibacteria group bacterium]